jgi:uncharacterized lipoprotein NlpE involved in copper resistance
MNRITGVLLLIFMFGCNQKDSKKQYESKTEPLITAVGTTMLGTYEGTIPCSNCDGILMTLTLGDNPAEGSRTYTLTEVFLGEPQPANTFKSSGSWEIIPNSPKYPDATVYKLIPHRTTDTLHFEKVSDSEIKLLNRKSITKESGLTYNLIKQKY